MRSVLLWLLACATMMTLGGAQPATWRWFGPQRGFEGSSLPQASPMAEEDNAGFLRPMFGGGSSSPTRRLIQEPPLKKRSRVGAAHFQWQRF